ncbi:hypothetical protein BDV26DRAFT_291724 [Aspergillus bertholletiae]|uniref:Arrestin-like N-terminal domain-containing protein n=1 Tax=Aspergillus bertholletiae TaxID=1226010 RepID=A0A5N7BB69_9EURO|nr:hypothetical protein BDV26DRAFT_291724 [Aspergillus bertholletiae]
MRPSSAVSIELAKHHGLENTYTTFDQIQGTASITVDSDTPVENISILFEGTAKVSIGRETCTLSSAQATQTFLQLRQPITRGTEAVPKVLHPGCSYKIPFTFVVPQYLPCHSCNHDTSCSDLQHAHLQLPPTLDDSRLGRGKWPTPNYASSGKCRISYRVRVVLPKGAIPQSRRLSRPVGCTKNVRVLPTAVHAPHPGPSLVSSEVCTRRKKILSRGFAHPGLGELVLEASHISALSLPDPIESNDMHSTMSINLRFNPLADAAPPQLRKVCARLQASTFYSLTPWEDYPSWTDWGLATGWDRGAFTETFPVMAFSMGSLGWEKHRSPTDDGTSSCGYYYYTASIVLPIVLPPHRIHTPTFHSCLISRTYSLNLRLAYRTPKYALKSTGITIKVPLTLQYTPKNGSMSVGDADTSLSHATVVDIPLPPEYAAAA